MFSEALKIADKNTVKYMMDELQEQLNQEHILRELAENKQKLAESELQQSKENERKLQEQLAILQSQLTTKQ